MILPMCASSSATVQNAVAVGGNVGFVGLVVPHGLRRLVGVSHRKLVPAAALVVGLATAAGFAGLSLYGYTTQRDLTGLGSFLVMGLFGVIIAGPISGAHLNPAVTLALAINGATPWAEVPVYWAGEMLGAFLGAVLVYLHYYPHWEETPDADLKLAVYSTGPAIRSTLWNIVSEVIGTFVLVFVIFAFANNKGPAEGLASLGALPVAL